MAVRPPGYTMSRLTLPIVMGGLQGKNEDWGESVQRDAMVLRGGT